MALCAVPPPPLPPPPPPPPPLPLCAARSLRRSGRCRALLGRRFRSRRWVGRLILRSRCARHPPGRWHGACFVRPCCQNIADFFRVLESVDFRTPPGRGGREGGEGRRGRDGEGGKRGREREGEKEREITKRMREIVRWRRQNGIHTGPPTYRTANGIHTRPQLGPQGREPCPSSRRARSTSFFIVGSECGGSVENLPTAPFPRGPELAASVNGPGSGPPAQATAPDPSRRRRDSGQPATIPRAGPRAVWPRTSRPAPSRSSEGPGNRAGGASAVTHSRARRRRLPANRLCGGRGRATLDLNLLRFLHAQKRAQCKQQRESLCRQTQRFDTWQTARRCPAPSPQVLTPHSRSGPPRPQPGAAR